MAKKWPILTLILLIGITAQSQKIFFEQLTTAEGLPSDYVNCVFEDSKGHLWIGTDKGACRYDGREFLYLSNDNGLPSNFISCFAEDCWGNIWIGTVDAGVAIFNGRGIKQFVFGDNQNKNIKEIQFNPDSSFFISVEKSGLYYFQNIEAAHRIFPDYSFVKKFGHNLFFTGVYGDYYLLEKRGHQFTFHPHPAPTNEQNFFSWMSNNSVVVLHGDALLNYVVEDKKWVVKNDFSLKRVALPFWPNIKKVLINENEVFIGTSNGLIYADNRGKEYHFTAENGLGTNFIQYIFKDKHANIYICTYGAGIKIWPAGYLTEFKINGKITSIFPAANETYITTNKSVYRYQTAEKKLSEIKIPGATNFTVIYKEQDGPVYLGTLNNFYKIPAGKFQTKTTFNEIARYGHSANSGTSGFARQRNNIFVSTYGEGIYLLDTMATKVDTLHENTITPAPLIIESLVPIDNSVAAVTYNSGLMIYDSSNKSIHLSRSQGLLSNTAYSVFNDKENLIWIGTKSGLNLFDGKKIIRTYSNDEGLVGTNALCIFRDKQERLWMLSDKYLHLVDEQRLRAIRSHRLLYDERNLINRATYSRDHNTLFIGLTDAVLVVDMSNIFIDTVVSSPQLLAVVIDTVTLGFSPGQLLSISSHASKISFKFKNTQRSFTYPADLYYKLIGFDDSWKLLSSPNEISYQKLSPGKYELIAKTINPDGFASPETSLLSFEVLPPLWKRNWFVISIAVVVLAIFFFVGHVLSKRRYKRKLARLQEEYRLQLERERIARELHDNVGSQLTYLINKIDDDYPRLAEKKEAEKLSGFARGAMQELRETIWALDKKEVQWDDLQNKIRQLISLYKNEKFSIELDWQSNGHEVAMLKSVEALNIYRIVQEALNNAKKYSGASLIKVSVLLNSDRLSVEIADNGKGFDEKEIEKGYGLKNMKKRAEEVNADLQIRSATGKGTSVKLVFP